MCSCYLFYIHRYCYCYFIFFSHSSSQCYQQVFVRYFYTYLFKKFIYDLNKKQVKVHIQRHSQLSLEIALNLSNGTKIYMRVTSNCLLSFQSKNTNQIKVCQHITVARIFCLPDFIVMRGLHLLTVTIS